MEFIMVILNEFTIQSDNRKSAIKVAQNLKRVHKQLHLPSTDYLLFERGN